MREAFITKPEGALTRARTNRILQIITAETVSSRSTRSQSDSAITRPARFTPKRVICTKRPLHTPFELPKRKIKRSQPVKRNLKPVVSTRRSSPSQTTPLRDLILDIPVDRLPSPITNRSRSLSPFCGFHTPSSTQEAPHLPSTPIHVRGRLSTNKLNQLAPRTPTSPNNTEVFELPPQELVWDNFSPKSSYQEQGSIIEAALDQLFTEENQVEEDIVFANNSRNQLILDDELPGSAHNASTSTHNISVSSLSGIQDFLTSTMTEEAAKLLTVCDTCLMFDEDCEDIVEDLDAWTTARLEEVEKELNEKRKGLQQALAYFLNHENERFNESKREIANQLRIRMRSKSKMINGHLREREKQTTPAPSDVSVETALAQDSRPAGTELTSRISSTTRGVKQARVNIKYEPLLVEMDELCSKFGELKEKEVNQLGQFNKISGQFKELLDEGQRTLLKARSLCEDAMCVDMEDAAKTLDAESIMLELEMSKAESFIKTLRNHFGVPTAGYIQSQRSANIPIPHFSGAKEDKFDLFTFKKKFQIYVDSMPSIAEIEALEILKEKCLQGNAQMLCSAEKSIPGCLKQLTFHYGSKAGIIAKRKAKIMELGTCPKFSWEQQITWMVKLRSLLADTQEFARENNAEHALYYGKTDIANSVLNLLKGDYFKKMSEKFLESADATGEEDGKYCYEELLTFLDKELRQLQYQLTQQEGAAQQTQPLVSNTNSSNSNSSSANQRQSRGRQNQNTGPSHTYTNTEEHTLQHQQSMSRTMDKSNRTVIPLLTYNGSASKPVLTDCVLCQSQHTFLYQCPNYISATPKDRRKLHGKTNTCHRCLRSDTNVDFDNLEEWWTHHKNNCRTTFYCQTDSCQYMQAHRMQRHILACVNHAESNKKYLTEFRDSLPEDIQLPTGDLLFMDSITMSLQMQEDSIEVPEPDTIPDVGAPGIFMCQNIPDPMGNPILVFYDSGCGTAAVSASAAARLNATEHRPGPTIMNVAGGKVIHLPYGSDKFKLPLDDSSVSATVIAAKMDTLTAPFPIWDLQEPYNDLINHYKGHELLPTVPDVIGGRQVDIILGIKYNYLFPMRICSLPCGLSLYRSPVKGINGHTGVLGGPHKAWARAAEAVNFVGAAIFFTNELSAYRSSTESLFNSGKNWCAEIKQKHNVNLIQPINMDDEAKDVTIDASSYTLDTQHVKRQERKYFETEDIGTQAPYRCMGCRVCGDCKKGDILEATSLKEEAEQLLIKKSVTFKPNEKLIVASLPFIADPVKELQSNRNRAKKVLESQLRKLLKDPETKRQVLESHDKLANNGYSCNIEDLTPEEKSLMESLPGEYYLPWRFVTKEGSLSTPVRVVFDASATTPTGKSLNDVLAKGVNKLEKILSLDLNFRAGPFAFACDIRMAYNQIKLVPADYRWHKYLWVDNLDPANPIRTRVMRTIIYGVKPSGNQTAEGLEQVAQYVIDNYPEHADGAGVLKSKTYVDDASDSADSAEQLNKLVTGVKFTLDLAGMNVKSFIHSEAIPEDTVSKDGTNVSYLGYCWAPLADTLSLAIKTLFFGKVKRGKRPPPVEGDIEEALTPNFTKRIILSKVASNWDPLGLCTPVTAKFKADYHDLLTHSTGWDDGLPANLLPTWVTNIELMQSLAAVTFPRSVVPHGSLQKVDLLVSVDASQNMAIVCVHVRSSYPDGKVTVRLAAAKSKIVTGSTIPRAELRAAVAGVILANTVAKNLKSKVDKITYFTDSTVVLSWIHQDARPLTIGVRSCVIEIRRFSSPEQWRHLESDNNIADLGTRFLASAADISTGSEWQNGKSWMYLSYEDMPVQTVQQLQLSMEAKQAIAQEVRLLHLDTRTPREKSVEISDFSKYLFDPCQRSWPIALRVMAIVRKFCFFNFKLFRTAKQSNTLQPGIRTITLSDDEIKLAERYYFQLATKEVQKFTPPKAYGSSFIMDNGIMKYNGRIVEGTIIEDVDSIMPDLSPLHFVRPIIDRHSRIAYSIMLHAHEDLALHRNVNATLLESRHIAFILNGRDLAKEIRTACPSCRKFKAQLLEAEMGPIHKNRLTIAPPFYYCQLDLMGPFLAQCEHNHRSTVKVWGLVCRDPASAATACFAMTKYNTDAFIQALQRFTHRYCIPKKVYIDPGAQLIKGVSKSEFSMADITRTLNGKNCSIEFEVGPTAAHNYQGCVERSIKEIKALFNASFNGLKLDVMSYETAFSYIANEINNMPICTVSRTEEIGHADLITPNRLIHGRNNRRAPTGPIRIAQPSQLLEQMERLYQSWWQVWLYERLPDYIPKPKKFGKTGPQPKEGDIVVFLRAPDEMIGDQLWRLGQISELIMSEDGVIRQVIIRWRKHWKENFHETRRSVRHIAILFSEDELSLVDQLKVASVKANAAFYYDHY